MKTPSGKQTVKQIRWVRPTCGLILSFHPLLLNLFRRTEQVVFLARVIGTVVATQKVPGLEGAKFMLVVPLKPDGAEAGRPIVACDQAQAGPGDHVFCVDKREATLAMPDSFVPVDAAIVGIVDEVYQSENA